MPKVCSGIKNEKEEDRGTRGLVEPWSKGPRVTGAPLCAKCSSVCSKFEPDGSVVVC